MVNPYYNNPPVPFPNPYPYPLATPLSNRTATPLSGNGFQKNCYVDKQPDGDYVVGRKGFAEAYAFGVGGTPQGLWYWRGYLFGASGNTLYSLQAPVAQNHSIGSAWTAETTPPWSVRRSLGAVVFKGQIVVIGGNDTTPTAFNDVWASSDGRTWTQLCAAAPWGGRYDFSAVVFNDRLYVMGGVNLAGQFLNDVWVTDDGNTWTQVTGSAGWGTRASFGAVNFNSGIVVCGGENAAGYLNDVWFSTDGSSWSQLVLNAAWAAKASFGCLVLGDKLFVFGGENGGGKINTTHSTKDGITWTLLTGASWPDGGHSKMAATVYEGKLWAMGGEITAAVVINDVYSSADGATWSLVTAAPGWTDRMEFSAVAFRTPSAVSTINTPTLYVLGGVGLGAVFPTDRVYRANINGANNANWSLPSPTSNIRMEAATALFNDCLVIKDTTAMFVFRGNTAERVVDPNYPVVTVPGLVNLNETIYVMDPEGVIYGSALENPLIYPAFKFIGADYKADTGVALASYKSYVVAFGDYTTELFYDAGAEFGPVLRPVQNVQITIGCFDPYSVVDCNDELVWVSRGQTVADRRVYMLRGTQARPISDPRIETILQAPFVTGARGSFSAQNGHRFYILSIIGPNLSFMLDLDNGVWYEVDFKAAMWDLYFVATDGRDDYYLRASENVVYVPELGNNTDVGVPITRDVYTNIIDMDTSRIKFQAGLTLVCDRGIGDVLVRYNDNDYDAGGWSAFRTINTTLGRRMRIARLGDFYRRAFHFRHSANAPFRVLRADLELSVGFQ